MAETPVQRWEDIIPNWRGPSYRHLALGYSPAREAGWAAGAIISCAEAVDWAGDGGRDLLVSSWDACYEGVVRLYRQAGVRPDGTPVLAAGPILDGVSGYAAAVADGDGFGLMTVSRLRSDLHLHVNRGRRDAPRFEAPSVIPLAADWLHAGELLHRAQYVDLDGDGRAELVVGTDFWGDYWPDGIEWFEREYRPYDAEGRWRGGPLRGHLYGFCNRGTPLRPDLARGRPLLSAGRPIEVYGMAAPAFGDFRGTGALDLVCGDFLDRLHFYPALGDGSFGVGGIVRGLDGAEMVLDHCVHFPAAVDWDGDGLVDLLVTAEDGFVWFLRNSGETVDGIPTFAAPVKVAASGGPIHAGIVPVPAARDWTGDGRPDLIVGNSAGELLFFANRSVGADAPCFAPEVRLRAGDAPVSIRAGEPGSLQGPAEIKFGYTCPTIADWDGDGRPDLLVGSVHGHHLFLRCVETGDPPRFAEPRVLTFAGAPLRAVWRVRPAVVDWDGDGALAFVCLDADGMLVRYRRESDTVLVDPRPVCFADGAPIRFTEDFGGGRGRIKLCFCDWTGQGRRDLVIGTHSRASVPPGPEGAPRHTTGQAAVLLLQGVEGRDGPAFAPPVPVRHRGEPIRIGMHACAPEAVTRPGRALPDLLVGAEDGTLLWFAREELSW